MISFKKKKPNIFLTGGVMVSINRMKKRGVFKKCSFSFNKQQISRIDFNLTDIFKDFAMARTKSFHDSKRVVLD